MAELVPNCSHVLHFSDEEVECLQKLLFLKPIHSYESFFEAKIDPNTLKKYPPHNLKQSIQGFAFYEIQNKNQILDIFLKSPVFWQDLTNFTRTYNYFTYLLLISVHEKIELPIFNETFSESYQYYHIVTFFLYRLITHLHTFESKSIGTKIFKGFLFKKDENFDLKKVSSIFIPIKNYHFLKNDCSIQ